MEQRRVDETLTDICFVLNSEIVDLYGCNKIRAKDRNYQCTTYKNILETESAHRVKFTKTGLKSSHLI